MFLQPGSQHALRIRYSFIELAQIRVKPANLFIVPVQYPLNFRRSRRKNLEVSISLISLLK